MIFDYIQPFVASLGMGASFLYEVATGSASGPVAATAIQDRIMLGLANAVTIREVTIGGFN